MIRTKGKLWCCGEEIKTHGTDTETENTSLLSFFSNSIFGQIFPSNMPHLASFSFIIYLSPVCASGHFLRLPAAINNASSHLDETTNNKHLRGETAAPRWKTTRRHGDNCEARFICFYSSVVFSAAVCNQHRASMADRRRDEGRMERRRDGGRGVRVV